ncbi:LysE family transporter [Paraburkholderia sp. CNPSo 3272]|uniref:LysE family transporter n=1 Tax=Paraburkholderia sp. CNPSo 3272 TaxID=2940931 RepID=UPI0020B8F010|nr:LysE family transporter [Paraburkholderia sp. CNPSo 3272]MCP3727828.1 LysE family transporter [Paraburkholderia sp. CNPSo 3272]
MVDMASKRTQGGIDLLTINPKGNVPVLELDHGALLTGSPGLVVDERDVAVHIADKGLFVFTACSHAGLINVLKPLSIMTGNAFLSTNLLLAYTERASTLTSVYLRGAMLHLTNPKAILLWVSIVALSSNGTASAHSAVIAGCAAIGCLVFGGYAVLFSTDSARRMYVRTRRTLEGCLAVVFGIAGIKLLATRV